MEPIVSTQTTYNWNGNTRVATEHVKLDYEKGNDVYKTIQRIQNVVYDTYDKSGKQVPSTTIGTKIDTAA